MFAKITPASLCVCTTSALRQQLVHDAAMLDKDINCNTRTTSPAASARRAAKSIDVRKEEVMAIRNRFPTKVPIIVQRFCKETALPQLDKSKYLVPQEITMSQFLTIIRNRMRINSTQTLYLLVNNRSMISLSLTLAEVYSEYAGVDGFLYVTYASQEVFGSAQSYKYSRCPPPARPPVINVVHTTSRQLAFPDNTYKSMCFG